jgi:hypothetical protein
LARGEVGDLPIDTRLQFARYLGENCSLDRHGPRMAGPACRNTT